MMPALRRAFRDLKRHAFLQILCGATIALSVFIVSAFLLFYINATDLLDAWKKGVRMIVYLEENTPPDRQDFLMKTIGSYGGVAGVTFVSGKSAFEDLKSKIGGQSSILEGLEGSPLPDAIEIRLMDDMRDMAAIEDLATKLSALSSVEDVEYAQKWLLRFTGVYNLFKFTGLVLAGMFFIATLLIVANTIRMIMYARQEEIQIMRIVGATESFIQYPLFFESLMQGLAGSVAGISLLYAAYVLTMPRFEQTMMFSFFNVQFIPLTFTIGIIVCSMVIGWVGCWFSIRRFLKT